MNYENRYVLFLDILGFKKIIETTYDKEEDKTDEIKKLYNSLKTITKTNINHGNSKRVTQFSDSIVVSFRDVEIHEFSNLLDDISYMLFLLAFEGVLCRGAIAYGKFYHDHDYLFGPALVEAYETESKAAMYPRVIIDKSVMDVFKEKSKSLLKKSSFKKNFVDSYLVEDFDDKLFIDYFTNPINFADSIDIYINYLNKLREVISNGLSKARSADIKVKYGWMKQKFNRTLNELSDISLEDRTISQEQHLQIKLIKFIR